MHSALTMIDRFSVARFGDLYAWYYGDQVLRNYGDPSTTAKSDPEITQEILNFELDLLKILR